MYIIAEIGTSHGGDINKAKQLIDVAKRSGADCVKFQWVYAKEILHPNTGFVKLPGGNIPLYERFKELEVPPAFFRKAKDYAHSIGIDFGCSPFGEQSLQELWSIKPDCIKIASPELNHFPMLEKLCKLESKAKKKIPIILSSGVSKEIDILKALNVFCSNKLDKTDILDRIDISENLDNFDNLEKIYFLEKLNKINTTTNKLPYISLLHCITSYPAPETEYNLAVLNTLSNKFHIPVGISDHSLSAEIVPAIAVHCNAQLLEKHITLSNETDGLDDPVALTPEKFLQMTKTVRHYEAISAESRLNELYSQFSKETVDSVIGTGIKELAPSEEQNYTRTNRSIHFMHDMKTGQKIKKTDVAILRTEKILTPGISPEFYKQVIGKKLKQDVKSGEGLIFEMIEDKNEN